MNNIPKMYIVVTGVVVLLAVGAFVFASTRQSSNSEVKSDKETVFEEGPEAIPTVDSSVQVEIEGKTEAVMTVSGIPAGTEAIEYELTYDTASGSVEGIFGSIEFEKGVKTAEETFIFGTSSSGVNRYHTIKGSVKGTFKFAGSYGEKILEKEFKI
jgi:hypothetical protein